MTEEIKEVYTIFALNVDTNTFEDIAKRDSKKQALACIHHLRDEAKLPKEERSSWFGVITKHKTYNFSHCKILYEELKIRTLRLHSKYITEEDLHNA